MKTYPRLLTKLFAEPLMLHAPARQGFEAYLLQRMESGGDIPASQRTAEESKAWRMKRTLERRGNLAIVHICGAIDKHISELEMECFGGCDLADVDDALASIAADPTIGQVLLHMDTPGGSVTGVPETAQRVFNLRATKEVHAFTEGMCCSAGEYIASQADHRVSTHSSTNGSIGVYMAILDRSRQLEAQGVKVELIRGGALKAIGASFKSMTEEERAFLQASVDRTHANFKAAIRRLRPNVSDDSMQGQWFDGDEAKERGIVDEVTNDTLNEYAARLMR
jgi:signal peptide peptidase SppA